MKEYLKARTKTNEAVIGSTFSSDEPIAFQNQIPEMSYEHRGLVIGSKQKLLYVLPIFSYDPLKHPDVYHPVDYPDSKRNLFLLKSSEFSFISHDSVLKLNDLRTVSVNRILYQQNGRIVPTSATYKQIESLTLQKYFPGFYYDYKQNLQTVEALTKQLEEIIRYTKAIETENKRLKTEITSFKK